MITRRQLEAVHRSLPADWTPAADVRRTLMQLLSLSEQDRHAINDLLSSLAAEGIAEHTNGGTQWRRGSLPADLAPHEALKAAQDKQRAEIDAEREREFQRRAARDRRTLLEQQKPERLRAYMFIDERIGHWLALFAQCGVLDEEQVAALTAAAATLPNPMNVPPPPAEGSQLIKYPPPDAIIAAV